jgi:flagellar biosynthetic protein FlhB
MSEDDDSQKTEDPTQKKLEDARKKGQVPLSREVNNWMILLGGTIIIGFMSGNLMVELSAMFKTYFEMAGDFPTAPGGLKHILGDALFEVIRLLTTPFLFLMALAFLAPVLQIGFMFSPEAIKPDFSKISLMAGFKRLFSGRAVIEFLKGLLKILVVGAIGVILVAPYMDGIDHMVGMPMLDTVAELRHITLRVLSGMLFALLVVTIIDVVYQRYAHQQKMMMSFQEVKDEHKQSEGDPHMKAKLRQLRHQRSQQRMMQAVPSADVVITNPTHFAIALKYDPDAMDAPKVIAKGADNMALKIREIAKEHQIEIVENKPLARSLYDLVEIEQDIPVELYKAVAEIISYVFKKRK